jgi:hypothetical protein
MLGMNTIPVGSLGKVAVTVTKEQDFLQILFTVRRDLMVLINWDN